MAEKNIASRIVHKHDTEANWIKATNFIPKQGEIIIYDIDSAYSYERFKIGDGVTNVNYLPFSGNTTTVYKTYFDANSGEGQYYYIDAPEITELTEGLTIQIVPHVDSTVTLPYLIIRNASGTNVFTKELTITVGNSYGTGGSWDPPYPNWIKANRRLTLYYQNNKWIVTDFKLISSADIQSYITVDKGGTGATNATDALKNLGIYIGDTEPTDSHIKIWINTAEEGTGVVPLLPRIATVTLKASSWTGSNNPYSQVVAVNGVTVNSKIDLQPTAQQIVSLQSDDIALMAENNGGTVTFYALGGKPSVDYTMQVLLTEVTYV